MSAPETEDANLAITALIMSAVYDESPAQSLDEVYETLTTDSASIWESLDPLNLLSPLIASSADAASKILKLMSDNCSPRELILAADEVLENISHSDSLNVDVTDDEHENDRRLLKNHQQVLRLMLIYKESISRVPFRKRELFSLESHNFDKTTGRQALHLGRDLASEILKWAEGKPGVSSDELAETKGILSGYIESIIDSLANHIDASLATKAFTLVYPRLLKRTSHNESDSINEIEIMPSLMTLYYQMRSSSPQTLPPTPTRATLLIYSQGLIERQSVEDSEKTLSFFLPVILATIQSNDPAVDATLSLLLLSLHSLVSSHSYLSPNLLIPLSTILPSLCVAHPNPDIRHYTFRSLSLLLKAAEPPLRMQILLDLTQDKQQGHSKMRTASISLVREAVVEALDLENDKRIGIFASPLFLKEFGKIVLAPDPLDIFNKEDREMTDDMKEELGRLTECLALYYVLIVRDKKNRIGILDKDNLANVERGLLKPMRNWLHARLKTSTSTEKGRAQRPYWTMIRTNDLVDLEATMPLVALQVNLERIDETLRRL
ncbi:hypothetical protein VNI00_013557 [Paramarasmius palmivorus]|uniref:Uncharacterized protein n=1 Tax=Paramarasmius palmivorus TaxID=297713 RepID=A0AAW0BWN1_9AGAR